MIKVKVRTIEILLKGHPRWEEATVISNNNVDAMIENFSTLKNTPGATITLKDIRGNTLCFSGCDILLFDITEEYEFEIEETEFTEVTQ